mgnify:CR=1 FL=1
MGPGGANDANRQIPGPSLGAIFSEKSKKRYPEINAKIDTEKVSENVAIEAKRGRKMRPKWVRISRIFLKGPRWVVLRKSSFYCNKTMVWEDSGLQESM